jgi:hypothetical protein
MSDQYRDCEHGQLARQCPHCENDALNARVAELEKQSRDYSDLLDVSQGVVRELRAALAKREAVTVPDELSRYDESGCKRNTQYRDGWNDCRLTMLASSQQAAKGEGT